LHPEVSAMPAYTTPPSEDDILAMADAALQALPPRLARHVKGIAILVEDMADEETLQALEIENPWELTGLYRGIPMTERSVSDPVRLPDTILLYRDPILIEWIETGEDLARLVSSVLVHEVAHHFGFSDVEIEQIEADMLGR
jgi:predicted Zn-dependent protease with MMP-like domain